tara:strand:+ start:536 stop:763 length:228 start_codon:yes stop_codon:yes gene_type:complete
MKKIQLSDTDYVRFCIEEGTFEFIEWNYPYIYGTESIEEIIWDCGEEYNDGQWIPTTELPKNIKNKLIKMIKENE